MNYELEVQKSLPSVFNILNGGVPPLVAGTGSASLLTTTPTTVNFNAWITNRELSPFSAEVWYLPVSVSAETVVMGHTGEGVLYDGTNIILRAKYSNSVTVEGRWTPPEVQNWHFVLVYTTLHWILYVNGEEVITLDVPANQTLLNATTTVTLNSGPGTGIYDSLALYYRALTGTDAQAHFALGKTVQSANEIASSNGALTWDLTYDNVDSAHRMEIDLSSGFTQNTAVGDGELVALDSTGGTWQTAVALAGFAFGILPGVHLTYIGTGVTLAYSIDGSTWTTTPNKTTILEDATPPGLLFIRLTLANDVAWVSSLRVDILNSRTVAATTGPRTLAFKGAAFDQTPGLQLDYHTDQGVQLRNGYVEIQPDTQQTPVNIAAIGAWLRFDGTAGWVMGISGTQSVSLSAGTIVSTGVTMYRNGATLASGAAAPVGQWAYYVFVLSTPVNTAIRFGDKLTGGSALNMSVGHLAAYSTAPTAAQVQDFYNSNVGAPIVRVDDAGSVGMSESVPAVDIYAYAWSIVSGGR